MTNFITKNKINQWIVNFLTISLKNYQNSIEKLFFLC